MVKALVNSVLRWFQSTYANPQDWFVNYFSGGNRSDSGIPVNRDSALTYSSVFSAVSIISSDVAGLPLNDTRLEADGDERVNRGSAGQYLLNFESSLAGNALMSGMTLRETLTAHALLGGNGYAAILRDNTGKPVELIPLIPDKTYPVLVDKMVVYHCEYFDDLGNHDAVTLLPSEVIHIAGLGYDGIRGYSVVTYARNSMGLGLAGQKHGNRHFKNDARPQIVLKFPGKLNKEQAADLLDTWNENNSGDEAGGTALAAGGLEVQTVATKNNDSQWLESRAFQKTEVAQWFQLPPHKLGDTEKLSYKSIEAENRAYLQQTLRKWLRRWECECNRKLVPPRERRSMRRYFKHDTSHLTAADFETRANVMLSLRNGIVLSGNEVRSQLGFQRTDDEVAGGFLNPNTTTDGVIGDSNNSEPEPDETGNDDEVRAAHKELIAETMTRLIGVESAKVTKLARSASNFVDESMQFLDSDFRDKITAAITPIAKAYEATGRKIQATVRNWAGVHTDTSYRQVLNAAGNCTRENLPETIADVVSVWPARAEEFANNLIGD